MFFRAVSIDVITTIADETFRQLIHVRWTQNTSYNKVG